jgi:hypothetical protein
MSTFRGFKSSNRRPSSSWSRKGKRTTLLVLSRSRLSQNHSCNQLKRTPCYFKTSTVVRYKRSKLWNQVRRPSSISLRLRKLHWIWKKSRRRSGFSIIMRSCSCKRILRWLRGREMSARNYWTRRCKVLNHNWGHCCRKLLRKFTG